MTQDRLLDRRTFAKGAASAAFVLAVAPQALAKPGRDYGAELVKGFPGLNGKDLRALLDRIEAAHANEPYVVAKREMFKAFLENCRPLVLPNDMFVDMVADSSLLRQKRNERCRAFGQRTPGLEETVNWLTLTRGTFFSHLDPSHTCPDWESILSLGLTGLAERARRRLETAADEKSRLFLASVAEVYEAASKFCLRWADAADLAGAKACAGVLRELAAHEPRTFREALQLMLVYDRLQEIEGPDVRSQGLFDRLYVRYYRDDLAAGRETRESAKALVKAVYDKFFSQGHPNGKNIAFGGYDRAGAPVWNELSEIGFELHHELNRVNPKLTYRYGSRTPDAQLLTVCRCLAAGRTAVVFFNDDVGREMFARRGKVDGDWADAVLIGCYEPGIMGREVIASMGGWLNLVRPLEAVFNNGRGFDGYPIGPACAVPADVAGLEAEYRRQLEAVIRRMLRCTTTYERHGWELNPTPLFSGCQRTCVESGRDAYDGGCKYNQTGVMCAGIGTVADSFAAVRWLVEETRLVTMAELGEILKANWQGREDLRLKARHAAPKWGNNDDRADLFGKRTYEFVTKLVNSTPNGHGGTFQAGFWSIDDDIRFGRFTGATPEGRKSGETLSRNNVATAGCGKEGATALVLTNAKLDQAESPDGFVLDVILPSSAKPDDAAAARIAAFVRTFAAHGGQTIHFNVFDSKTLRDAQAHPEKYEDLQVRVCGWNARWNDLSKLEQDHFIATAEAQGQ